MAPRLSFDLSVWFMVLIAAVGALVLLAGGTILFVVLARQDTRVSLRRIGSKAVSLLWVAPVVAVVLYLAAAGWGRLNLEEPHGSNSTQYARRVASGSRQDAVARLGEPSNKLTTGELAEAQKDDAPAVASPLPQRGPALPDWVRKPYENGGTLRTVSSKQYATRDEAQHHALVRAAELVETDFHSAHPDYGRWMPSLQAVRRHAVRQQYAERIERDLGSVKATMYRAHLQVELSPDVREKFYPEWRAQVVTRRLWILGSLFAMLTLIPVAGFTYFRLDGLTGGAYRVWLKLAAVALILAGGLCSAAVIHVA